jgi:hypothetical protein
MTRTTMASMWSRRTGWGVSAMDASGGPPVLLTRMSMPPMAFSAAAWIVAAADGCARSAVT